MTSQSHPHDHDEDEAVDLYLTILCWLGLGLATLHEFLQPLPPGLVWGALGVSFLAGGVPPLRTALHELFHDRRLDIDLLMVVAALAAAAVGAALEGAVLLALFSLSHTLEHRSMGKARRAVEALMQLRPETALLEGPDGVREVPVESLVPGDRVILRPGARVPVDGRVAEGAGHLDESTVTGESAPVRKAPGDPVHEATVNLDGILTVEVTRSLATSTVAQMIKLVTEAQAMKSPSERFSDWFGQRYTIAVLAGSILSWFGFRAVGYDAGDALYRSATLLVAASPCAVVISVPAAILSALSAAARGGVLFKGGAALEGLAEVKTFAFDKTGTLTTGLASVTNIVALEGTEDTFLALAAGLEAQSEHPIAAAIRREADERGIIPAPVRDVRAHPSEGITGIDADGPVWGGNARMLAAINLAVRAGRTGRRGRNPGRRRARVADPWRRDRRRRTAGDGGRGAAWPEGGRQDRHPDDDRRPRARRGPDRRTAEPCTGRDSCRSPARRQGDAGRCRGQARQGRLHR
jgi:Zn2+/Cd2+-exporting ATPase